MKRSGGQAKRAGATKRRSAAAPRRAVQDVPQFAPNFTVYVLPPDAVCLYSEDRKFFLHGELYCALATAIGKGGKSFAQLAQELSKSFPPDKIEEALKRLMERGYIVPASPSSPAAVDGYWASLGLPPGVAEQNLRDCRVRVEAIDVKGAAELGAALSELGVAVVVAEAAADAEAAVAGLAEAAAVVVAAALPGAPAACAEPGSLPVKLTYANRYGRVRQRRPGQSMFCLQCGIVGAQRQARA